MDDIVQVDLSINAIEPYTIREILQRRVRVAKSFEYRAEWNIEDGESAKFSRLSDYGATVQFEAQRNGDMMITEPESVTLLQLPAGSTGGGISI